MSNKLDFFDKIVFATKEQMTTGKFWECMGEYGRVWEAASATHTQYRNSWRQCPSDLSDLSDLSDPSDSRHLSSRPQTCSMILILPGSHSGVAAEKSAKIPHIAKAQLIGDFFQWQTGFFQQSSGFQHL